MHVLVLDVDSLRPDHTSTYGYELETTPNIDRIAADGTVFSTAYATNSPCMPSRAALISGRYGLSNGVTTHGPRGRVLQSPHVWEDQRYTPEWWTLPELFFNERIRTVAVSSFPRHPAPWFYHLWHEFYNPQEPTGKRESFQTPRAADVADLAIDALREHATDDTFVYAQFWDPHTPYKQPGLDDAEGSAEYPLPPHPTAETIEEHQTWDRWRSAPRQGIESRADLADVLAKYDNEIEYVDEQIGRVVDALEAAGIYDDTLLVVTADHGEEFGEHGLYSEHWSTYEGTQRIPLIVKPPADAEPAVSRVDTPVTNVDIAPTIADYAGLDVPGRWQGESLRPLVESTAENPREFVVVEHGLYTAQRAIRTAKWKLIRTYHAGLWEDELATFELYDLEDDPWEQQNLVDARPEVVAELREKLLRWVDEMGGVSTDYLKETARTGPAGLRWAKR
ncbi:Arylsulfatase A [Halogranum amylolyticum]|uniref:Arylsulfatase A n=1 Tax=Halogranum amylolyticum TaxID=660520 RepID=A0A1H8MUC2_9EURY|nr:sulfatase [Halogranum amylolyticum]SEO21012.1 Arylsulfatase A [Halogranum amylolyticum]